MLADQNIQIQPASKASLCPVFAGIVIHNMHKQNLSPVTRVARCLVLNQTVRFWGDLSG